MENVLKVEISVNNIGECRKIIINGLDVITDNAEKTISKDLYNKLFKIICMWDSYLLNDNLLDGEEYRIKIFTDCGIDVIEGKGKYPVNYSDFKKWFGEVYE